jgi:hypothetical protein
MRPQLPQEVIVSTSDRRHMPQRHPRLKFPSASFGRDVVECPARVAQVRGARTVAARRRRLVVCRRPVERALSPAPPAAASLPWLANLLSSALRGLADGARGLRSARRRRLEQRARARSAVCSSLKNDTVGPRAAGMPASQRSQ